LYFSLYPFYEIFLLTTLSDAATFKAAEKKCSFCLVSFFVFFFGGSVSSSSRIAQIKLRFQASQTNAAILCRR